jgi:hypothetical protein
VAVDAQFYVAESERGDVVADPSEDSLYMRISDLAWPDNTFLTVEPPGGEDDWHVVVSLLEEGGYEVEFRHRPRREHRVVTESGISDIAREVIIWLGEIGTLDRSPRC